jgi:hypothetical protein
VASKRQRELARLDVLDKQLRAASLRQTRQDLLIVLNNQAGLRRLLDISDEAWSLAMAGEGNDVRI